MEHFYQNLGENWFTYPGLYSMVVDRFPTNSHFVEVGVWKGMSAVYMAVEIINSGTKFDSLTQVLTPTSINSDIIKVNTYPIKSNIEDFYLSNSFTKNSLVMNQCSQLARKSSTNFPEMGKI